MKTYRFGNLTIACDRSQAFPDDPGRGTPAMVSHKKGFCATLWCAMGEGRLHSDRNGDYELSERQVQWLEDLEPEITEFLYGK